MALCLRVKVSAILEMEKRNEPVVCSVIMDDQSANEGWKAKAGRGNEKISHDSDV
jgi:hypothetical protein